MKRFAVACLRTGLFYNPGKPGNRKEPTFHKTPKLYSRKGSAILAQAFCSSGVNDHWVGYGYPHYFDPIPTEIVEITLSSNKRKER